MNKRSIQRTEEVLLNISIAAGCKQFIPRLTSYGQSGESNIPHCMPSMTRLFPTSSSRIRCKLTDYVLLNVACSVTVFTALSINGVAPGGRVLLCVGCWYSRSQTKPQEVVD